MSMFFVTLVLTLNNSQHRFACNFVSLFPAICSICSKVIIIIVLYIYNHYILQLLGWEANIALGAPYNRHPNKPCNKSKIMVSMVTTVKILKNINFRDLVPCLPDDMHQGSPSFMSLFSAVCSRPFSVEYSCLSTILRMPHFRHRMVKRLSPYHILI